MDETIGFALFDKNVSADLKNNMVTGLNLNYGSDEISKNYQLNRMKYHHELLKICVILERKIQKYFLNDSVLIQVLYLMN